jgi:thiol-disulfide isomerase/thioredoxin
VLTINRYTQHNDPLTMAYIESSMMPLGTVAPDFELPDLLHGGTVHLHALPPAKATVVMFLCNHCPYVLYINPELVRIVQQYSPLGVSFLGINSNDARTYPEDAPETMQAHARAVGYSFPYLFDETQETAHAYDAACTPDFFVFDSAMNLAYRGQLDPSRPKRNPIPSTGIDLRAAIDAILAGTPVNPIQRPSGGCNIKWKHTPGTP